MVECLLNGRARSVQQAQENRVSRASRGPELWLIEGADEEWVVGPLDCADLAGGIGGCDAHPMFARDVLHLWR
jgi:hypothetical protein